MPCLSCHSWPLFTCIRSRAFRRLLGRYCTSDSKPTKATSIRKGNEPRVHDDDDDDEEAETLHSLETMTWLRWLWFILGTLPPAIKLMSMRGVPWEQAWGMMFLTSWIINESLTIYAATHHTFFTISRGGRISWPGFEQMDKVISISEISGQSNCSPVLACSCSLGGPCCDAKWRIS